MEATRLCVSGSPPSHSVELDGLRGIAIALVLVAHLRPELGRFAPSWRSLAGLGVELFFVISGFLITRILLSSRERPRYFRNFFIRRALRIFPIYYLFLSLSILAAILAGKSRLLILVPFYVTYLQTIPHMLYDYQVGLPWTAHTWSLAIEEQFYWIWPFLVFFVRNSRLLAVLLTSFLFLAPASRVLLPQLTGNHNFMSDSLPSHLDTLAAGALLALAEHTGILRRTARKAGMSAAAAGTALMVFVVLESGGFSAYDKETWQRMPHNALLFTACAVLFGGCVALAVTQAPLVSPLLRLKPLVRLGKISYGVYLYHPLLLVILRALRREVSVLAAPLSNPFISVPVALAVIWGVSELSWRVIEAPLLSLKDKLAPSQNQLPGTNQSAPAT